MPDAARLDAEQQRVVHPFVLDMIVLRAFKSRR